MAAAAKARHIVPTYPYPAAAVTAMAWARAKHDVARAKAAAARRAPGLFDDLREFLRRRRKRAKRRRKRARQKTEATCTGLILILMLLKYVPSEADKLLRSIVHVHA